MAYDPAVLPSGAVLPLVVMDIAFAPHAPKARLNRPIRRCAA